MALTGLYDVILSDPPWDYYGGKGMTGGARRYRTVPDSDMAEVARPPLARRGVLFMWCTSPRLDFGMRMLEEWGLYYRGVAFVWVKTRKNAPGVPIGAKGARPSIVKPTSELVLAASRIARGRPLRLADESVRQIVLSPYAGHSEKPEAVPEAIERLYPDARRLEMFARCRRLGWDAHGDEVPVA